MCIVLFEVVLRMCGFGRLEIYEPDARLYWRLKPNQTCFTKVGRKPVRIDSHGTRGTEFTAQKPANTLRILSLGDSRTFGWGLSEAETYSVELGRLLQANLDGELSSTAAGGEAGSPTAGVNAFTARAGRRVEVINAGVNAWSYQQMLVFYRDIAVAWQPDVVIVGEANLWTQFSEGNSPEFVKQFILRVRLKNLLRRSAIYHFVVEVKLRDFYERHRTKFIPVDPAQDTLFKEQQQADPEAAFREAITELCRMVVTNGATPVLLFLPRLEELDVSKPAAGLQLKRGIAGQLGTSFVNVAPDLVAKGKALYLEADPVHLNAQGNAIVAQRLFETMTNSLVQ
ncbi:MAG: hypothetical protein IH623_28450 [Verrucomicrobia bacterium]|nr:hypothetical protein [Verrucomicrobiota bacterium]